MTDRAVIIVGEDRDHIFPEGFDLRMAAALVGELEPSEDTPTVVSQPSHFEALASCFRPPEPRLLQRGANALLIRSK
jgi:hypothetical protein